MISSLKDARAPITEKFIKRCLKFSREDLASGKPGTLELWEVVNDIVFEEQDSLGRSDILRMADELQLSLAELAEHYDMVKSYEHAFSQAIADFSLLEIMRVLEQEAEAEEAVSFHEQVLGSSYVPNRYNTRRAPRSRR